MGQLSQEDILALAKEHAPGMPAELALATWQQESNAGKNTSTSSKGAKGAFQVTPIAAKDVGMEGADLSDPVQNAIVGIKYLDKNYKASNGNVFDTAARYFAGPKALSRLQADDGNITVGAYAGQVRDRFYQNRKQDSNYSNEGNAVGSTTPATTVTEENPLIAQGKNLMDKVWSAFSFSSDANADAIKVIDNAVEVNQATTSAAVDAVTAKGKFAAEIALDAGMQMQAKAANAAKNASIAGIGKDDVNSLFSELVQEYNVTAEEARQLQKGITAKSQVGFLDSPVDFLRNQFVDIPQMTEQHNNAVRLANLNADRLTELNALVQTQNVTDNAQIADASMRGAMAAAELKVAQASQDVATLRAASANQIAALSVNKTTLANKTLNELQQMEAIQTQEAYRKMLQAGLEDRNALAKAKVEQQARFAEDLKVMGYTPQTFGALKKESQDAVIRVIETGRLGNSPVEAILNLKAIPTSKLTVGQGYMGQLFVDLYNSSGVDNNKLYTKKEDKIAQGNAVIKETFNTWRNNPGKDEKNPFNAPSPGVMSEIINPKEYHPTFIKTLETIGKNTQSMGRVDDLMIIQSTLAAVGQEGYTREGAINDITRYYKTAIARNNDTFRFQDYGIPQQQSYKTNIRIPQRISYANTDKENDYFQSNAGLLSTQVAVDLSNDIGVASLITLLQAKSIAQRGKLNSAGRSAGYSFQEKAAVQ